MIQELLGAAGSSSTLLGETKISINGGPHHHHGFQNSSPSCPPSTISTKTTTTTTTSTTNPPSSASAENANNNNNNNNNSLRCPRCDSANTKFCYYNNYNLTQPRHFCKTCRRYWTKGGALRNVPIGGGCRKNKNTIVTTSSKSSSAGKFLKTISPEMITGRACYELPPNPILWGPCSSSSPSSPQSSHLLALLRAASQNPNPNHSSELTHHMMSSTEPMLSVSSTGSLHARATAMDHLVHQAPSLGLSNGSMWRSNTEQQAQQQNGGVNLGVDSVHNSGMQELYQRLIRSSTTSNYFSDNPHLHSQPLMLSNAGSFSSPSGSSILESATQAVGGGSELGYGWNSSFSWSDLSTTNGAYP